ncbi:hypothetical protein CL633_01450 [bacterium]|nr:hypothetical protein [bacterium]|tara:strand:+ start:300 stop:623 length:324 start_codon:yes stop_codon:yes gene_type:complete
MIPQKRRAKKLLVRANDSKKMPVEDMPLYNKIEVKKDATLMVDMSNDGIFEFKGSLKVRGRFILRSAKKVAEINARVARDDGFELKAPEKAKPENVPESQKGEPNAV